MNFIAHNLHILGFACGFGEDLSKKGFGLVVYGREREEREVMKVEFSDS